MQCLPMRVLPYSEYFKSVNTNARSTIINELLIIYNTVCIPVLREEGNESANPEILCNPPLLEAWAQNAMQRQSIPCQ